MKDKNKGFPSIVGETQKKQNSVLARANQNQNLDSEIIMDPIKQQKELFQLLVQQKDKIYDKNYVLQKQNPLIEQYIESQINKIPKYVINCNQIAGRGQFRYDSENLKFLYLLIINKQHTLLTDIINTRTVVRKNKEVCEYLILNIESLERELEYLLFYNDILQNIKNANFQGFQKDEFKEFYVLVQIINEIFNSILVRKQKEAFEDMRERNLPAQSQEHQAAIQKALAIIEQISSQVCLIKISGWLLNQQINGESLSEVLFSQNELMQHCQNQIELMTKNQNNLQIN